MPRWLFYIRLHSGSERDLSSNWFTSSCFITHKPSKPVLQKENCSQIARQICIYYFFIMLNSQFNKLCIQRPSRHTASWVLAVTSPHYSPANNYKADVRACWTCISVLFCTVPEHASISFSCTLADLCARRCTQCAGVMRDCLLVLAPVVFNPSPEARISSSLSHRPALSLAEHLAMQALINTGMAILSVTGGGVQVGDWCQHEKRGEGEDEVGLIQKKKTVKKPELSPWWSV